MYNKIDTLIEQAENGGINKVQAYTILRGLRSEVSDLHEQGSKEYTNCIESLKDAQMEIDDIFEEL